MSKYSQKEDFVSETLSEKIMDQINDLIILKEHANVMANQNLRRFFNSTPQNNVNGAIDEFENQASSIENVSDIESFTDSPPSPSPPTLGNNKAIQEDDAPKPDEVYAAIKVLNYFYKSNNQEADLDKSRPYCDLMIIYIIKIDTC
jgi:hypothetical protein